MWARSFLIVSLIAATPAGAKVFNYQDQFLAGYIRGGGQLLQLDQDAFAHSSGAATDFSDSGVQYGFSGELGAQLSFGSVNLRLGMEAFRPKELDIKGNNTGGAELFTLTSGIFAFSPMMTLEYIYSAASFARFYAFAGVGYTMVTLDNHYEMTAAGTTAFGGLQSYTEKADATAFTSSAGMGFETMFVDNCAFAMDFGYRYLEVGGLKHKGAYSTIGGPVAKGDDVTNADGSKRHLSLSGMAISASFKFFLNF